MITMITSKLKVYPNLQDMIGIIHLDRLYSEWSNNNKIPYMTKSYKKIKNIPYKNRNNIFGYYNNKMLLRTFSMPNNWLVDGEITAEENYLISIRKMCRKIRFNKDVRADVDSKIISIRYFNTLMFELSFKDNRQVFQHLNPNSIKGIKITLCDKHNVSIDRLNYLYKNHRYDDLFRELCKRYEVYVSISHYIMDYSEKTRKDISDGNFKSVGIELC